MKDYSWYVIPRRDSRRLALELLRGEAQARILMYKREPALFSASDPPVLIARALGDSVFRSDAAGQLFRVDDAVYADEWPVILSGTISP